MPINNPLMNELKIVKQNSNDSLVFVATKFEVLIQSQHRNRLTQTCSTL
jgi:hypothetical protein